MKKHPEQGNIHKKAIDWELAYCFRGLVNDPYGGEHDNKAVSHSTEAAVEDLHFISKLEAEREKKLGLAWALGNSKPPSVTHSLQQGHSS